MNNKFTDGAQAAYAELPLRPAYLRWTRGNVNLRPVAKSDPGLYFGGWRAAVKTRDGEALPKLPIPIVERMTDNGKAFSVYASNVIEFLPIQHRTRFELRQKVKDPATGRENTIIRAVSKARREGFTPVRQVFGLVFPKGDDNNGLNVVYPAVLLIDKWNTFISFERAGQKWNKVAVPEGYALIRRYGTVGKDGYPVMDVYGESKTTPIDAIGTEKPRLIQVTPALEKLWQDALAWKECPRWNGEGAHDEIVDETDKQKFLAYCKSINLNEIDIEQLIAENDGNYAKALKAVQDGNLLANGAPSDAELDALNQQMTDAEEVPIY